MKNNRYSFKMTQVEAKIAEIIAENEALRERLTNLEETLRAIQHGEVDALVVSTPEGEQVFALSGAEKFYRVLIEGMKEGAVMLSDNNTILYCNSGFAKIINKPLDSLIGNSIQGLVSPTHLALFEELLASGRKNEGSEKEICLRAKDNSLVPTHMSVTSLRKDDVETTFLIVTDLSQHMEEEVKDYTLGLEEEINKRKKIEKQLTYTNERLILLSEIANRLLSTSDPQALIQELCEKVMTFLGCDVFFNFLVDEQQQKLHLNAYAGVSAEIAKTFEWLSFGEAVCGCAAQEGKRIVCENIPDTQDVRTALVRSFGVKAYAANPIFSEGKVIGTLSFGTKKKLHFTTNELSLMKTVTAQISVAMERKIAEEKIRKSQENEKARRSELEALMDAEPDYIFISTNPEGSQMVGNKATEELLQLPRGANLSLAAPEGQKPINFHVYDSNGQTIPPEGLPVQRAGLTAKPVRNFEFELRFTDGHSVWLFGSAVPIFDNEGKSRGAIGAFTDITKRKQAEELANQRTKELEILHDKLEDKAVEVEEYANQMEQLAQERLNQLKNAERLSTIGQVAGMVGHDIRNPLQVITSNLYLAILDLMNMPASAEKTNILENLKEVQQSVDYINKIVADLQDYARVLKPVKRKTDLDVLCNQVLSESKTQHITFSCMIEDEVRTIITDPDLLKRALSNLVSNGIQAMPNGGKLTIQACFKENKALINVTDTGVGIPDEVKPKLFTPLFTTKSKGQGFGLATVKRMTEALGGTITFESQVGKGTKFTTSLPVY